MQKVEIATRIHQEAGIPIDDAARLLDWFLEFLKTTLRAGESITIAGFGKFTVRDKHERPGRNPKTGEAMTIAARRVVTFRPSHLFKKELNPLSEEGRVEEVV